MFLLFCPWDIVCEILHASKVIEALSRWKLLCLEDFFLYSTPDWHHIGLLNESYILTILISRKSRNPKKELFPFGKAEVALHSFLQK